MAGFTGNYYVCQLAGLGMIVGGIWLIFKQKIYIDRETNQPTEIEIPLFGKLKTNVPALVLFALSFIPLIYPLTKDKAQYVRVRGAVTSELHPVVVYAVVETKALQHDGGFDLPVPLVRSGNYTPAVVYVAGSDPVVVFEDPIEVSTEKAGAIELLKKQIQVTGARKQANFEKDVTPGGGGVQP